MSSPRKTLASIVGMRAWKLALVGRTPYWFFPIFYVLLSTNTGVSPAGLTALVVAMMLSAAWGFLLNDLADRDADASSGRADALHGHGLEQEGDVGFDLFYGGRELGDSLPHRRGVGYSRSFWRSTTS